MVRIATKFMPVNSTHLEYDANAAVWSRARDVFARETAGKDILSDFSPRHALGGLTQNLTVKKWVILVKKRSSFECSINHLRRTAGKAGQVSFGRVGCGGRIEILGARAKRDAKTAISRQEPPTAVDPMKKFDMAGFAFPTPERLVLPQGFGVRHSSGAFDHPRLSKRQRTSVLQDADAIQLGSFWFMDKKRGFSRAVEFPTPLRRHFFSGHLWSRLVIFDAHSDLEIGPPNRFSDRFRTDSFPPCRADFSHRPPPIAHRLPPTAYRIPGARRKTAKKSAKSCQTTRCKPAFTGLGHD